MKTLRICLYFDSCPRWGKCDLKFDDEWKNCPDIPKEAVLTTRKGKIEDGVCVNCEKRSVCRWLKQNQEQGLYIVRCRLYREEVVSIGTSFGIPSPS